MWRVNRLGIRLPRHVQNRQTLRRLRGVIRPRPLGGFEKAVGTFPAKCDVGLPQALGFP